MIRKRMIFDELVRVMNKKQIPLLIGLRRVGKTTLLRQIENEFPNTLYLSFDKFKINSSSVTEVYNMISQHIMLGTKILLIDEVQEFDKWDSILKLLYDEFVATDKVKIIATGSSTLSLENKETGVDRIKRIYISTLSYHEYLRISGKSHTPEEFEYFLCYGGFPGRIHDHNFDDLINEILYPILNIDIPRYYKIKSENILKLTKYIALLSNGEFNKDKCSKTLQIKLEQLNNYIEILEKSHIIIKLSRTDVKIRNSLYEKYKIYINPHMHLWLLESDFSSLENKYKGHIIESYYLFQHLGKGVFWNRNRYLKFDDGSEIDLVEIDPQTNKFNKLIEFKYTNKATDESYNSMFKVDAKQRVVYCKENTTKNGIEFKSIFDLNTAN